jgi:hypothetical protein
MEKTKLTREEIENQLRSDNTGISEEDLAKLVEEKLAAQETDAGKSAAKMTIKKGKPKSKKKDALIEPEEKVFRVAVNFNKILEIPALSQREVYEELKKSMLGDFIDRDNLTFIGS